MCSPALDHGAGAVLGQGQQDAHTGVQVLRGAQAADISRHFEDIRYKNQLDSVSLLVETPKGEAVTCPTGNIPSVLEEVKTLLCSLRDELVVRDNLRKKVENKGSNNFSEILYLRNSPEALARSAP